MGFYGEFMGFYGDFMGFARIRSCPPVNVYITNWKDPPFFMEKLTISMAIFNSYVKLPEGITVEGITV